MRQEVEQNTRREKEEGKGRIPIHEKMYHGNKNKNFKTSVRMRPLGRGFMQSIAPMQ